MHQRCLHQRWRCMQHQRWRHSWRSAVHRVLSPGDPSLPVAAAVCGCCPCSQRYALNRPDALQKCTSRRHLRKIYGCCRQLGIAPLLLLMWADPMHSTGPPGSWPCRLLSRNFGCPATAGGRRGMEEKHSALAAQSMSSIKRDSSGTSNQSRDGRREQWSSTAAAAATAEHRLAPRCPGGVPTLVRRARLLFAILPRPCLPDSVDSEDSKCNVDDDDDDDESTVNRHGTGRRSSGVS